MYIQKWNVAAEEIMGLPNIKSVRNLTFYRESLSEYFLLSKRILYHKRNYIKKIEKYTIALRDLFTLN